MEVSKAFRISTDYKDGTTPNWETLLFVEVIFVDNTHPSSRPLLYQLSDHKLTLEQILNISKSGTQAFSRETFVLVGEILSIDKKKKQVSLSNNNIVAYNHLVIASGKKPVLSFKDNELSAALQALTDALRVKPKIPASFPFCRKSPSAFKPQKKDTVFAWNDKA
ncbi:MAG TPA: hypothetical protein VGP47_01870, partial [Parachlamydiaceae bacterium]|nr:hypothetical protein [Parachlamydiaceae bacterium]